VNEERSSLITSCLIPAPAQPKIMQGFCRSDSKLLSKYPPSTIFLVLLKFVTIGFPYSRLANLPEEAKSKLEDPESK
jgi:hypothetical protein